MKDRINSLFAICIPARYGSTRFPGKPLEDLGNGKNLIQHVYDTCASTGIDTYVLTDSVDIMTSLGDRRCMMTIKEHENGTSRCAEFMYRHRYNSYQYIINVQGDMVDVRPDMIEQIFNYVSNLYLMNVGKQIPDVLSLYTQMKQEDRENPHVVKCIHNNSILAKAIWFLRAPLQYGSQHLGIYGYTKDALLLYNELIPEEHEDLESLEQLRWCVNDINFRLLETDYDGQEINTPEDLEKWKEINNDTR